MSQRLIDANALQNLLIPIAISLEHEYGSLGGAVSGVMKHIDNMPAIDAVPVVRCRDCIGKSTWYKNESSDEFYICGMSGMYIVKDTDYCSFGERKENRETNDGQSQG